MSGAHQLPSSAPRTLHVANLAGNDYEEGGQDRAITDDPEAANVISSIRRGDKPGTSWARHLPVLDIDIPAILVPSSTPGHSHLYLDVEMPESTFWKLCDALAEVGVLQHGYVIACKSRGYTSVRLPWIKKSESATESQSEIER